MQVVRRQATPPRDSWGWEGVPAGWAVQAVQAVQEGRAAKVVQAVQVGLAAREVKDTAARVLKLKNNRASSGDTRLQRWFHHGFRASSCIGMDLQPRRARGRKPLRASFRC